MKLFTTLLLSLLFWNTGFSQPDNTLSATDMLKKVYNKLSSYTSISYTYHHETWYYGDNYHYVTDATLLLQYSEKYPGGFRFQASGNNTKQVFNGNLLINLYPRDNTMDTSSINSLTKLNSNSFLYHSIGMLRNVLPQVIEDTSFRKSIQDTVLEGKPFYCIRMEKPGVALGLFKGTSAYKIPQLQRPYFLIIDKNSLLPYQFISKYIRGNDDKDFVAVTYNNINIHPQEPMASSWQLNSYTPSYSFKAEEKKTPVKPGTIMPDFTLPAYSPQKTTSISLQQFSGKLVLLDFWFKSCGYCMEAMPHYNELQRRFDKKDFELVTVNIMDSISDIKFFYNKFNPDYPMLYNGGKLFDQLGFSGCPSSVLIDRNGKILQTFQGFNRETIEKQISQLINNK